MKIYDCFMYFDEDVVLDLRLNYLNNYVDKFVIVESKFSHSGEKRHLKFNIKNFENFKKKIIYIVVDHEPPDIQIVKDSDDENTKAQQYPAGQAVSLKRSEPQESKYADKRP